MSNGQDTPTDDAEDVAMTSLTRIIEEVAAEGDESRFMACAIVELMRATELVLQIGEGSFELMQEEFRARLEQFITTGDVIVDMENSRFLVILRSMTSSDHLELATTKLKRLLSPAITVVNHSVLVQANAGFALMRVNNASAKTMLHAAESALQRCSPAERYVIYDPEAVAKESDAWGMKVRLETALSKGELMPYFEPVVTTAYGNLTAAAAILAWNAPGVGLQPLARQIRAVDDSEMLRPVYWQFIKSAIGQASKWSDSLGLILPLPVELFRDDAVAQQIIDALEIYSVKPSRLTVEVQEQALASASTRELLEGLRQRSVRVRIADIGDGGLPLAQIGELPADEISFSRALLGKSVPNALRTLIFETFKRAGLKLVATHVKDERLANRFKALGFVTVQGAGIGDIQRYDAFAQWAQKKIGA